MRVLLFAWLLSVTTVWCGTNQLPAAEVPDLRTRRTGSDWPGFLGPTADGKSPETGLRTDWKTNPPRLLWQRKLVESYGMPSVARGRLVLFDREKNNAVAICLHAETGKELWRFEYPTDYRDTIGYDNGPRCAPVIDGERVYLFGVEGMLHCLATETGKPLWKVDTAKDYNVVQNFFGVGATPIIEEKLLLVQIGGSPAGQKPSSPELLNEVTPAGSLLVAFDKFTGREVYRVGDDLASYAGPVCTTINGRRLCLVFGRSGLTAVEPSRGTHEWFFPWRAKELFSVNASNPIVVGDEVFLSECYGPGGVLLKVKDSRPVIAWQDPPGIRDRKALQTHWCTPIVHEGFAYASSGRHSNTAELRCVNWRTGEITWAQPGLSRSSLLYVDKHLICLTEYGDVVLLSTNAEKYEAVANFVPQDPVSGERLLDYPAWAAPILSHGLLYLRGNNKLVCYEVIPTPQAAGGETSPR